MTDFVENYQTQKVSGPQSPYSEEFTDVVRVGCPVLNDHLKSKAL